MSDLPLELFRVIVAASSDPVLVLQDGRPEWPVTYSNSAFAAAAGDIALQGAFADVCEALIGRDAALDVSEAVRSREQTRLPVTVSGHEYVLSILPLDAADAGYTAVFLRDVTRGGLSTEDADLADALLKAKKTIRNLDRTDAVTGLLNDRAFRDVLTHDWAVASRERSTLALVCFSLVDFEAYQQVFGRHASDSCLRRVGQAIRRCLRRASDVAARINDGAFVVLLHAADETAVEQFARQIAASVRELGIHHPRSSEGKYVSVHFKVESGTVGGEGGSADEALRRVLDVD